MVSVVGYVRVSTDEQAKEGISIEAQEKSIRAYCEMRGLTLVELVLDAGVSAGKALDTREGGRKVLSLIRTQKVTGIVAYKLDRLFRDCADCLLVTREWDRRGTALHLIDLGGQTLDTSTPMGRFFMTVMAGAAELERNQISERTKGAMALKRRKGERISHRIPYGKSLSQDRKSLVDNPAEMEVIRIIRALRSEGLSQRRIVAELAARGLVSRAGKSFQKTQVARILKAS